MVIQGVSEQFKYMTLWYMVIQYTGCVRTIYIYDSLVYGYTGCVRTIYIYDSLVNGYIQVRQNNVQK